MSLTELSVYHLHIFPDGDFCLGYIHSHHAMFLKITVSDRTIWKRLAILNITTINRFQLDTCFI